MAGTLLVMAAGCTGGSGAPAAPQPASVVEAPALRTVTLGEAEIRAIAEIMLMEDRRALDESRIADLTVHWSPQVRRRAALALGRAGEASDLPLLLRMLADEDASVSADAAFAIGLLGDSSASAIPALSAAARAHPADSIGTEAIASLAKVTSSAAYDSVVAILASTATGAPTPIASQALLSLWRFGRRPAASLDVIAPFARGPDATVRWRALYPFVRNGLEAGVRTSLELASDQDAEVRALAVRGLRVPAIDSAGVRDSARATLLAALSDDYPHVRINALGALSTLRDSSLAAGIRPLLSDPDGNVRMAAVQARSASGGAGAAGDFESITRDDDERIGIRIAALGALGSAGGDRATAIAVEWAESDRWLLRLIAARTLASAPWSTSEETLRALAADADVRVARAAIGSVARSAEGESAMAVLLDAVRAPDAQVRAAAIGAIARRGSAADLALLLDAYEAAQRDTIPDAAEAAVNGLALVGRNGTPVANAFFERFEPHPDARVRQAVARRIGDRWGDSPEEGTQRGLAFYEEVIRSLVVPVLEGAEAPVLRIITPDGPIDIELAAVEAPLTAHNIISLVESGYYDSNGDTDARRWHRVVPNFVLQDGEPAGDGSGSPGYSIRDEINRIRYDRGVLGMALSGPDTGGGQFFITHSPQPHLDGGYTIFGRVVNGMDAADAVVQDDPILGMEIIR